MTSYTNMLYIGVNIVVMDRMITQPQKKPVFNFEWLDLFPYSLAVVMFCAEVYIIHQFVALTPVLHH
ncbi:hypothetical protein [Parafilimonas terrae]|jgi:hypothetical protein|nr:hypothetical protein [Parafilimonas terrae]